MRPDYILNDDFDSLSVGYTNPISRVQEEEKEMDKEKDKDKEMEEGGVGETTEPKLIYPFTSDAFVAKWAEWKAFRKKKKKPFLDFEQEQNALDELKEFDEEFSIGLIRRSIAAGYQGLVFPKDRDEFRASKNGRNPIIPISKPFQHSTAPGELKAKEGTTGGDYWGNNK